jgi:type II secretory pathway pseudopilin PulG
MEPEKKSNGTLTGVIIIIIILIVGGIYTWQAKVKNALKEKAAQDTIANDASALDSLNQDLQNTDTNLNVDVDAIR